jgi:hypothetical protein
METRSLKNIKESTQKMTQRQTVPKPPKDDAAWRRQVNLSVMVRDGVS